jgi:threonine/homoserine/homoserine lactone efflux protein
LVKILQCAGGAFLLYLVIATFKSWRNLDRQKALQFQSARQTVLKAALVNLLNPAPYIGWSLVMDPLLPKGWLESPANGIGLLIGFYTTMVLVTFGIMLLFAAARNLGPRVNRGLVGISSIALTGFGLYELWRGNGAFWRG